MYARLAILAVLAGCAIGSAHAAQRHFVASYGVDTDPCSLLLPCRSFAAAAAVVDPDGEIIVLDAAGYGAVTLTQSVSIISPRGIYAGISVFAVPPGPNGITVNAPGGSVKLSGLSINGQGGAIGILVQQAAKVTVDGTSVTNMANEGFSNAAANARIAIRDSVFNDNGGVGILSSVVAQMTIDAVHANRNGLSGISIAGGTGTISNSVSNGNGADGISLVATSGILTNMAISAHKSSANLLNGFDASQSASGLIRATIAQSALSGNTQNGARLFNNGQGQTRVVISQSQLSGNVVAGISAENVNAVAMTHGNTITNNAVGVQGLTLGAVWTASNNSIVDNVVNGAPGPGVFSYAPLN